MAEREVTFRELQDSIKDINKVVAPTPKIVPVGKIPALKERIIGALAPLADAGDERLATLAGTTIEVYNILCAEVDEAAAAGAAPAGAEAGAAEAPATTEAAAPVVAETTAAAPVVETAAAAEVCEAAAEAGEATTDAMAQGEAAAATAAATGEIDPAKECPSYGKAPDMTDEVCKDCQWAGPCVETAKGPKKTKGKTPTAAKTPKEPKPPAQPKYSRADAFTDVLLENKGKTLSMDDLIMKSNQMYAAHGGKENKKEAQWAANTYLKPLANLGFVKIEGNNITFP